MGVLGSEDRDLEVEGSDGSTLFIDGADTLEHERRDSFSPQRSPGETLLCGTRNPENLAVSIGLASHGLEPHLYDRARAGRGSLVSSEVGPRWRSFSGFTTDRRFCTRPSTTSIEKTLRSRPPASTNIAPG